eukprot:782149-Rhodomonas_salina.3
MAVWSVYFRVFLRLPWRCRRWPQEARPMTAAPHTAPSTLPRTAHTPSTSTVSASSIPIDMHTHRRPSDNKPNY